MSKPYHTLSAYDLLVSRGLIGREPRDKCGYGPIFVLRDFVRYGCPGVLVDDFPGFRANGNFPRFIVFEDSDMGNPATSENSESVIADPVNSRDGSVFVDLRQVQSLPVIPLFLRI